MLRAEPNSGTKLNHKVEPKMSACVFFSHLLLCISFHLHVHPSLLYSRVIKNKTITKKKTNEYKYITPSL